MERDKAARERCNVPNQKSPSKERRPVAMDDFSSRERNAIQRMLTVLNSSLQSVVSKLEQLAKSDIFNPQYLQGLKARTREIETEIRTALNF